MLTKGMTAMRLKIVTKGGVFGEDCILEDRHCGMRDMVKVNCLTFVQVREATCGPWPLLRASRIAPWPGLQPWAGRKGGSAV